MTGGLGAVGQELFHFVLVGSALSQTIAVQQRAVSSPGYRTRRWSKRQWERTLRPRSGGDAKILSLRAERTLADKRGSKRLGVDGANGFGVICYLITAPLAP